MILNKTAQLDTAERVISQQVVFAGQTPRSGKVPSKNRSLGELIPLLFQSVSRVWTVETDDYCITGQLEVFTELCPYFQSSRIVLESFLRKKVDPDWLHITSRHK